MINLEDYLKNKSLMRLIFDGMETPIFKLTDVVELDTLLVNTYGNRTMFSKLSISDVEKVANSIIFKHRVKWVNLFSVDFKEHDIRTDGTHISTEVIELVENRVNEREDVNLISGYDSPVMVDNDGTKSVNNEDFETTKTRTLSDGKKSLKTHYENLSLIDNHNIMDTVLKDIANFLTLDIYT